MGIEAGNSHSEFGTQVILSYKISGFCVFHFALNYPQISVMVTHINQAFIMLSSQPKAGPER